jgi:hypothetical protein
MYGAGTRNVSTRDPLPASDWTPDDESAEFVQGSLIVDAFDGATGKKIWHGKSRAEIYPDHIDEQILKQSVDALVSSFPRATP